MKKKTLKRGRKSKEEKLEEKLSNIELQKDNLITELNTQADRYRERIERMLTVIRRLEADKQGLNVAVANLGNRIEELRNIPIYGSEEFNNFQVATRRE